MKKVVLIIDGLADIGKTALELSKHPNLDLIAKNSLCGLMYPVKGIATESGLAQFVILGYSMESYPGRGVLEALGIGLKINNKNVYLRCNFAYVKNSIVLGRAKIPNKNIIKRLNEIDKDIKVIPTIGYRGAAVIKNASANIIGNHPGYVERGNIAVAVSNNKEKLVKGERNTALKLNRFIKEAGRIMKNKTIFFRGASNRLPKVEKLKNWFMIADMPIEWGLGRLFGMKILKRGNEIEQIMKCKGDIYVQIKGPDTYGHLGDLKGKIKEIERIDKMIRPLLKLKDRILCITSDHATPYQLKRHSKDPVAIMIYPGNLHAKRFTERECRKTGFRIEGRELMKFLNSII